MAKLDGPPLRHECNRRQAGDWMFENACIDERTLDGAVGSLSGNDRKPMITGGEHPDFFYSLW
jgi:hypothetical protein